MTSVGWAEHLAPQASWPDAQIYGALMLRILRNSLGLIAGFFARTVPGKAGRNVMRDIATGIVGALIGSWLFSHFGSTQLVEFAQDNILIDVIGAAALFVLFQAASSSVK